MNVVISVGLCRCNTVHARVFPSRNRIGPSSSCELAEDGLRGNCGGGSSCEVESFKSWMRESSGSCSSTRVEKSWRGCELTEEKRD